MADKSNAHVAAAQENEAYYQQSLQQLEVANAREKVKEEMKISQARQQKKIQEAQRQLKEVSCMYFSILASIYVLLVSSFLDSNVETMCGNVAENSSENELFQ